MSRLEPYIDSCFVCSVLKYVPTYLPSQLTTASLYGLDCSTESRTRHACYTQTRQRTRQRTRRARGAVRPKKTMNAATPSQDSQSRREANRTIHPAETTEVNWATDAVLECFPLPPGHLERKFIKMASSTQYYPSSPRHRKSFNTGPLASKICRTLL